MNKFQKSVLIFVAILFVAILVIGAIKKLSKEEVPTPPVEVVEPAPVVEEDVAPKKTSSNKNPLLINNISFDVAPKQTEDPKAPVINVTVESTEPKTTAGDIFEDQENTSMPTKEKLYTITPQKGSPLKPRENITLEQLRDYVIQTNYQIVAFREKMATASEDELIDYLKANGFTIEIK